MTSTEPTAATGASSGSADLIETDSAPDPSSEVSSRPEGHESPTKVSIFGATSASGESPRMDDDPPVRPRPMRAKNSASVTPVAVAGDPVDLDELDDPTAFSEAVEALFTGEAEPRGDTLADYASEEFDAEDVADDAPHLLDTDLGLLDTGLIDDLADDEEFVVVATGGGRRPRGKLKARKVRRIVRYVSPWSVFKVSLLFYFCMWVVLTIAGVILWQLAVQSGQITNFEKFLAKLLAESSYTIDGRALFRAFASAGVVLVFAGTGFTVLMSLLFNVICDITGGVRFTVLELESTRREIKTRNPVAVQQRAASGEFLKPVNKRHKTIRERQPRGRRGS